MLLASEAHCDVIALFTTLDQQDHGAFLPGFYQRFSKILLGGNSDIIYLANDIARPGADARQIGAAFNL